jgi:lipopolysaccharide/colanic/teichoic acid biosynthesis glycosyltransferase
MTYLPLYSAQQRRRHEVRPGITGWAQVHGRNDIPWERKFELDEWYVDYQSLCLDLRILWMTAVRVLRAEGISEAGHVSTEPFTGDR